MYVCIFNKNPKLSVKNKGNRNKDIKFENGREIEKKYAYLILFAIQNSRYALLQNRRKNLDETNEIDRIAKRW